MCKMPPNSIFSAEFDGQVQNKPLESKSKSTNPISFQDMIGVSPPVGIPKNAQILASKSRNPDG